MYTKQQVYKALNAAKDMYNQYGADLQDIKNLRQGIEKDLELEYVELDRKILKGIGIAKALFWGANVLWGFLNIVPGIVFAVITVVSMLRSSWDLKSFDKNIEETKQLLKVFDENMEEAIDMYLTLQKHIDKMQDVVYSDEPITKEIEQIADKYMPEFLVENKDVQIEVTRKTKKKVANITKEEDMQK